MRDLSHYYYSPAPQAATPETAEVGRVDLGDWLGGEAIFVSKHAGGAGDEDDGFLVSFVSPKAGGNSGKHCGIVEYDGQHTPGTVFGSMLFTACGSIAYQHVSPHRRLSFSPAPDDLLGRENQAANDILHSAGRVVFDLRCMWFGLSSPVFVPPSAAQQALPFT